jgi:hypothetical protein
VHFFTDGVSDLQLQLNHLLSPFQLRITLNTIFCHQSTTVDALPRLALGKGSELADLAILVRYGHGIAPLQAENIPPGNVDPVSRDRSDNPEGGLPNFLLVCLERNSEAEEKVGRRSSRRFIPAS